MEDEKRSGKKQISKSRERDFSSQISTLGLKCYNSREL